MYPSFFVAVRHAYYREGSLENHPRIAGDKYRAYYREGSLETKQSPEIAKWGAYYREGSLEI